MPVPFSVPWARIDHTGAKHDIYQRYLERWFPILLKGKNPYPSATYVEGFSGPGVYKGGEPGSPIIAMQALLNKVGPKPTVRFVLVDDDDRCIKLLTKQFAEVFPERPRPEETTPMRIRKGTCADLVEGLLDEVGAWGQPIIAVFDSWGNVPVPPRLLKRLANNVATEVIVTFAPQHFMRFVSQMGDATDEVFAGDTGWREIDGMDDPAAKRQHLLTSYRESLKTAGFRFLLDFELIDVRGESLYLIFATNHPKGVEKMKDSLWEVDRVHGVGFRDPRDQQHETLFDFTDPQLTPLGRLLLHQLERASGDGIRVNDLQTFALHETVFRHQHVIQALIPLRDSDKIVTDPPGAIRLATRVRLAG